MASRRSANICRIAQLPLIVDKKKSAGATFRFDHDGVPHFDCPVYVLGIASPMAAVPKTRTIVRAASKRPFSQNETDGFNKR